MTPEQKLITYWHAFCDADQTPMEFADEMESAGLIMLETATREDVERTSFAYELGIVEGEPIYVLTPYGRAVMAGQNI